MSQTDPTTVAQAAERYTGDISKMYPWPCDMHEQPAQRSQDAAILAQAYLDSLAAPQVVVPAEVQIAARKMLGGRCGHCSAWMLPCSSCKSGKSMADFIISLGGPTQ